MFTRGSPQALEAPSATHTPAGVFLHPKSSKLLPFYADKNGDRGVWDTTVWNAYQMELYLKKAKAGVKREQQQRNLFFAERVLADVRSREAAQALSPTPTSPSANDEFLTNPTAAPASPATETDDDEEPYVQDHSTLSTSSSIDFDRKRELIKPGDVLLYYTHLYPAGDKRGRRVATVIGVDPKGSPILTLSNSECLQDDTQVCRIKTLHRNEQIDHKGIFRAITDFKLSKKQLDKSVNVGFRSEGERMAATLKKNLAKFKEAVGDDTAELLGVGNKKTAKSALKSSPKSAPKSAPNRKKGPQVPLDSDDSLSDFDMPSRTASLKRKKKNMAAPLRTPLSVGAVKLRGRGAVDSKPKGAVEPLAFSKTNAKKAKKIAGR